MMTSFSQRDARWANVKIGSSNLTIGRFGCTISCIADLTSYFLPILDPAAVAKKIAFNSNAEVLWQSCNFPAFIFDRRQLNFDYADILAAYRDPNRAVILNVANASHWVVVSGINHRAGYFNIADPWLGDFSDMSRYKNSIQGAAYFRKK